MLVVAAFAATPQVCRSTRSPSPGDEPVGRQGWQPFVLLLRRATFDRDVFALDETPFLEPDGTRPTAARNGPGAALLRKPITGFARRLRARAARPRHQRRRRAAEQRDEFADASFNHLVAALGSRPL